MEDEHYESMVDAFEINAKAEDTLELKSEIMGNDLYEFIKHGDDEHKKWLQEKSVEWAKHYIHNHIKYFI